MSKRFSQFLQGFNRVVSAKDAIPASKGGSSPMPQPDLIKSADNPDPLREKHETTIKGIVNALHAGGEISEDEMNDFLTKLPRIDTEALGDILSKAKTLVSAFDDAPTQPGQKLTGKLRMTFGPCVFNL
jgi:hypothetical protein